MTCPKGGKGIKCHSEGSGSVWRFYFLNLLFREKTMESCWMKRIIYPGDSWLQ